MKYKKKQQCIFKKFIYYEIHYDCRYPFIFERIIVVKAIKNE